LDCPQCGRAVSSYVKTCPQCGYRLFRKRGLFRRGGKRDPLRDSQRNVIHRAKARELAEEEREAAEGPRPQVDPAPPGSLGPPLEPVERAGDRPSEPAAPQPLEQSLETTAPPNEQAAPPVEHDFSVPEPVSSAAAPLAAEPVEQPYEEPDDEYVDDDCDDYAPPRNQRRQNGILMLLILLIACIVGGVKYVMSIWGG
jgi:hypothetical protein